MQETRAKALHVATVICLPFLRIILLFILLSAAAGLGLRTAGSLSERKDFIGRFSLFAPLISYLVLLLIGKWWQSRYEPRSLFFQIRLEKQSNGGFRALNQEELMALWQAKKLRLRTDDFHLNQIQTQEIYGAFQRIRIDGYEKNTLPEKTSYSSRLGRGLLLLILFSIDGGFLPFVMTESFSDNKVAVDLAVALCLFTNLVMAISYNKIKNKLLPEITAQKPKETEASSESTEAAQAAQKRPSVASSTEDGHTDISISVDEKDRGEGLGPSS